MQLIQRNPPLSHNPPHHEEEEGGYEKIFDAMQALIQGGMRRLLPADFDFQYSKAICDRSPKTNQEYGWLVYDLMNHFVRALGESIVSSYDYKLLEGQTQKLEAEVRSHIKLEQEIKLYIDSKSRTAEKHKQEYLELRRYVSALEARLKEYEGASKLAPPGHIQRDKSSRSNLSVFKALLSSGTENKEGSFLNPLNKRDEMYQRHERHERSERSSSLQTYLSPKLQTLLHYAR